MVTQAFREGSLREDPETELSVEEAVLFRAAASYCLELERRFTLESEVAFGVNWQLDQAVRLGPDAKDRNYPNEPGWMYGTVDILGMSLDKTTLFVGDWKTGGTDGAEEQLLSLLAASRKAFQAPEGEGVVPFSKFVISCLQVTERGVWPHEREVSTDELDAHWRAMAWQAERIGQEYKPVPGIHCVTYYCPHLAYCTAIADILDDSAEADAELKEEYLVRRTRLNGSPKDGKEAAYTMERVSAAKRQLNYLTESMKEYVKNGGEIISGQWQWGPGRDGFRWRKLKT